MGRRGELVGRAVALVALMSLAVCRKPPEPESPARGGGLPLIQQMLTGPEADVDLAVAKLTIDKLVDPTADTAAAALELESIAHQIRSRLPADATSSEKVAALRAHLYEAGSWNDNRPFHYDLDDPYGHALRNKLLPTYLATRKGNCISMPMLFIVLGQKLGVDLTASTAPGHVFVKYRDERGAVVNLETTSGAGVTSDAWIQRGMPMTPEAISNGIYMQRLSKKETVAVMLETLMQAYGQDGRQEERIALATLALERYPLDVAAMLNLHAAYGRMIQVEFQSKYASPRDIPAPAHARFRELDENCRLWRKRAEDLGWREPSDEAEAQYQQRVNFAKSAQ